MDSAITNPTTDEGTPITEEYVTNNVIDIVTAEAALVRSTSPPSRYDAAFIGIYQEIVVRRSCPYSSEERMELCVAVLEGMHWRMRLQTAFWAALCHLMALDLVTRVDLDEAVDFSMPNADVLSLAEVLQCFSHAKLCGDRAANMPGVLGTLMGFFEAPTLWLATIILRSNSDPAHAIVALERLGLFGAFDVSYFRKLGIEVGPGERVETNAGDLTPMSTELFFWLPLTFDDLRPWSRTTRERWGSMKRLYEQVMGEGTWGDDTEFEEIRVDFLESI